MAYKSLSGINSGGGGGSGVTFTDGVNTVADATQLTVSGGTISGATPDATLTITGGVSSVSNSDGTLTISPTTGNVVASLNPNHANTWTALQQFNDGDFSLKGLTSGTITLKAAAIAGSNTITWPAGTTDFSSTGGTSFVVRQSSTGAALTVSQLAASDLSNGTTGSGSVVLATGSTMVNPIVGTQSASDNSTKAASTAYVTTAIANAIAGVNPAVAVQAATTAAADTSGFTYNNGVSGVGATFTGSTNTAITIDGFTFTALGQRLLVKNDTQSPSGAFNGVYYVTQLQTIGLPPILTRALDYDAPSDINNTGAIPVVNGTVNGTTSWVLTSTVNTVGTDPLTYTKFSLNPNTIQTTTLTNTHIWVGNGSNIAADVAVSGSGATITLSNAGVLTISAIANASLTNSSVTISGHSLSLGGSLSLVANDVGLGNVTNDTQTKAAIVPNTAPSAGQILVGNAGGTAYAPATMSSDATLASTGAITIANNAITTAKIDANAVTFAKIQTSSANTLLGFDGSGNAADVAIGSGLSLSGGTLTNTGGGGGGGTNLGLTYAFASGNLIF